LPGRRAGTLLEDNMEKKFEDDELKDFLEEMYIREAELLEADLLAEDDLEEDEMSDAQVQASFEKLEQRLKDEGVYRPDPKEKKVRRFHGRTLAKAAGVIVVSGLCVFAASMTSEANRKYFVRQLQYISNPSKVVVDNAEENESSSLTEYEAREEIAKVLNVKMPILTYTPPYFEYVGFSVDRKAGSAQMEYEYSGNRIVLSIDKEDIGNSSRLKSSYGEEVTVVNMDTDGLKATITETMDSNEELPIFTASWSKGDVLYLLSGRMELEDLEKVIINLKY
jgi:hypothetical protein